METNFQPLLDSVAALKEVKTSVITLLDGISAKLEEALADDANVAANVQAVKAEIDATRAEMAEAVVRHTPAE